MAETLTVVESIAAFQSCYYGHPSEVVEVWEPGERFKGEGGIPGSGARPPNRIGCKRCNRMVRIEGDGLFG